MNRNSILIRALVTASLFVGPHALLAQSHGPSQVRTETVRYDDLDLTAPSGVAALDRRLAYAINRVCNRSNVRDIGSIEEERQCRQNAWSGVNSQRATALARANEGPIQLSSRR